MSVPRSQRNGYICVTSNYNKNLIAAAEYGLNPEIHIFKYPHKELIHKFKADTTIKVLDMVFSRDGKFLLIIGGLPDFKISIYDLENSKKMNLVGETKMPCKPADYKKTKFNPATSREFCILSTSQIYFFKIHQAFDIFTENNEESKLDESDRLSQISYKNDNPEITYTTFIWDQFKRIHVCTDFPQILMIDSQTATEENTLSLSARPTCCLMTQKHLMVATEDSLIHWVKILQPEIVMGQENTDQKLKITDEIEQEYKFEPNLSQIQQNADEEMEIELEPVNYMHYTRNFKKLIVATNQGLIGMLAIEAEAINEDDDDEDVHAQKEKKVLVTPFVELGRFHTKGVTGIKELGDTTQVATISEDMTLVIWESTNCTQLTRIPLMSNPTALDATKDGKVLLMGSDKGILRVFDVVNRGLPRLLKTYKFYENHIPLNNVLCSQDGKHVIVSSKESDTIFILSQEAEQQFEVYGHITLEGYVNSACFCTHENQVKVLAALSNSLLAGICLPDTIPANRMEQLPIEITRPLYRKVDKGLEIVLSNFYNGDIFLTGEDRFLKKYDFPNEQFSKIDLKKPPNAPLDELKGHELQTTCWDFSNEVKFMATGGKDGAVILRNMNQVTQSNVITGHAVFNGGVTALAFSKKRPILYSAGGDGTFIAWNVGAKTSQSFQPVVDPKSEDIEALDQIEAIDDLEDEDVIPFKEILQENFYQMQEDKKLRFKDEIELELNIIKHKLHELLQENERVTDIEKLERDDFVIDIEKQNVIIKEGDKICEDIRKDAEKTVLKLELLRERVIQNTWDKMEVQSRAVKSIKGESLVFNYGIRKRTPEEQRKLDQIINFRRNELREKLMRLEQKLAEVLDEADFSTVKENYIMNRVCGKPYYEEDNSVQEAAALFAEKDKEKKLKKEREEKKLAMQGQQQQQPGKRQPIIKITKGKLGQKTKKKDPDEEMRNAAKDKLQARDIKGMEEIYWAVHYQIRNLEEMKKALDKPNIWDLIYEGFELYTDTRKRLQIELLREVIFELKRDCNKEFDSLVQFKDECLFSIKEKNDQIQELLTNLSQEEEIFQPDHHILEEPKHIFDVDTAEITVERFLTKEERAKVDEERKKQEEREKAMQRDNVGQRGLKVMMGGTELNLKKDQGNLQTELPREDWMNKPVEEMNDEEKYKLKEFEQKEKEFKEKQKKAWEQDLKKIKGEILEIQLRFEERILQQIKRKLFYDVRVYEQELYLIRLTIMLHDARETKQDEKKYIEERDKLEQELKEREELIQTFYHFQQDQENQLRNNTTIQEQEKELKRMFPPDVNIKLILQFVRQGKTRKGQQQEQSLKEQELEAKLVEADPFVQIDKDQIKSIIKEDDEDESTKYSYERDNIAGLSEEDFERLVQERLIRIKMEKDKNMMSQRISQMKDHVDYLQSMRDELNEKYQISFAAHKKAFDRVEKLKYNFEVMVYLKQGQVEVPQLPVATDYKDAILIKRDVIEKENKEIVGRGDAKVRLMNSISEFKTGLKRVRYQKKKLDLEITDFEERAKDVQLYRVTKQTQEIIQGKHQKKDEEDKKRLEGQIKQLEENAQKRIKTLQETKMKLRREIREKMMENDQLESKARQLQQAVDQRTQIMKLKTNTANDGVQDPTKKIKEIAYKRKLLDICRQQNEELDFLKEELDRLRARTFPSFAHLHNKPEYPDEA